MACMPPSVLALSDSTLSQGGPSRQFIGQGSYNLSRTSRQHATQAYSLKRKIRAHAIAVTPQLSSLGDVHYRKYLAEQYGFRQIGEPVPSEVSLKDILESLPKNLLDMDDAKAWKAIFISTASYALGLFAILKSPWYLQPLAWMWTGTAMAGFFSIGHECGHRSFLKNKLVEDIVGTLVFLPLIYPFEAWRYEHDRHHAKTNMLLGDTGWHPIQREDFECSHFLRKAIIYGYGILRPWMTIAHWLMWHFDVNQFRPNEAKRVKASLGFVCAYMATVWPFIVYNYGVTGWINLWLMPWLVYHFWMSVVTMIHHTAPHISFKPQDEWHAAEAQLYGTIHCDYPKWIEFFIHDINYHVPHHICPKIPCYNLRPAHEAIRAKWGKYINEASLNWKLMKTIMTTCHVYDKDRSYVTFDELAPAESTSITFLRKMMPEWT